MSSFFAGHRIGRRAWFRLFTFTGTVIVLVLVRGLRDWQHKPWSWLLGSVIVMAAVVAVILAADARERKNLVDAAKQNLDLN